MTSENQSRFARSAAPISAMLKKLLRRLRIAAAAG